MFIACEKLKSENWENYIKDFSLHSSDETLNIIHSLLLRDDVDVNCQDEKKILKNLFFLSNTINDNCEKRKIKCI